MTLDSAFEQYLSLVRRQELPKPRRSALLGGARLQGNGGLTALLARLEESPEFQALVGASDAENAWRLEGLQVRDATKHDLMAFLRLAGIYRDALESKGLEAQDVAANYREAMNAEQNLFTYLALLEGVEFSKDRLDCGGFEVRKFSPAELADLVGNPIREAFFDARYHIDVDTLAHYWFAVITASRPVVRWQDEPVYDLRVQVRYSEHPAPVETALRRIALFNWHTAEYVQGPDFVARPKESWGPSFPRLPFVISLSDSLVAWPSASPDSSRLYLQFSDDFAGSITWLAFDESATDRFERFMLKTAEMLRAVAAVGKESAFIELAMSFLLKACVTDGIEQLLWNITAIEAAVGEDPVMSTLLRRVPKIFGETEGTRRLARKALDGLYDFRSNLVHGNSKLPTDEIYQGHLRQARDFARGTACWMLNFLAQVGSVTSSGSSHFPGRKDLLKLIDLDVSALSISQITAALAKQGQGFPFRSTWLMD